MEAERCESSIHVQTLPELAQDFSIPPKQLAYTLLNRFFE